MKTIWLLTLAFTLFLSIGQAGTSHFLCEEAWLEEDWTLFRSEAWQGSYANMFGGIPIQTWTRPGFPFPYYRVDLTFTNVSAEFLYRIETSGYPIASKHWIPQLVAGRTVDCDHPDKEQCPQWLYYSFAPTPFVNRDVCQIYCPTTFMVEEETWMQVAVRTVPFEHCASIPHNETAEIHMEEHVAKFFRIDGNTIHYTYVGMEDPKGDFPVWFMRVAYPWAYKSHEKSFIEYVGKHNPGTG